MRFIIERLRRQKEPQLSEEEERHFGLTAVDWAKGEMGRRVGKDVPFRKLKEFIERHKRAEELRGKYFVRDFRTGLDPKEFFPIEAYLFDLLLAESLLKNEVYQANRALRVDIDSRNFLASLKESRAGLKGPEQVHKRQKELRQMKGIISGIRQAVLGKYADEIGVDQEIIEFRGWVRSLENLVNRFSSSLFHDGREFKLSELIDESKNGVIGKRETMLQKANLQLTS